MRRGGCLSHSFRYFRTVLIPGEPVKKSLKPLNSPPPKLPSPMKIAMRNAAHGIALVGLLVGGAVWTISQQQPVYANPGKLLRLPATVVDASPNTVEALQIGEFLNKYTKDRTLAFRIAAALVAQGEKHQIARALLVGVLLTVVILHITITST